MLAPWPGTSVDQEREYAVLVVEDDAAIRRLVKMVLRRERFHVEEAADGLEAVLKLGLCEYDVIILDLMMPLVDGFTFLETFAEHDPERLRKVIVSSAASPAVIRERMRGQPFGVLPKPFDITMLLDRVRACIRAQVR